MGAFYSQFKDPDKIMASLRKYEGNALGNQPVGSVIRLKDDTKCVVLDHLVNGTLLITRKNQHQTCFSKIDKNDYHNSSIRNWLNGDYYTKLKDLYGEKAIIPRTVELMSEDGTGAERFCTDKVSLITTHEYRKYRDVIGDFGGWWWTATAKSFKATFCSVCCIDGNGLITSYSADTTNGYTRPLFVLDSSIIVEPMDDDPSIGEL